jgi:TPR repeat protein
MILTWQYGGRLLSSDEHYVHGGVERLKIPLMFKIGSNNGKDLYGYLDHEKLGLSPTLILYVLKKCSYGIRHVGAEGQGIVVGESGGHKIKLLLLGDFRIASYTTWEDREGRTLILFDKVFKHNTKEEAAFHTKRMGSCQTYTAKYEALEDEAKDDGGTKAVPSSISADGFIRYTQVYDSELLRLVLEDQELYQQMFELEGPTNLVLKYLLTMFLPDGKGGRHITPVQQEGITEKKWEQFFRLALQKASPGVIEAISPGSIFELLELIVRIDYKPAQLLLNDNVEWRDNFWQQLQLQKQNPLELFFSITKINADLFKLIVDCNPYWLLGQASGSNINYFTRLALYLEEETNRDSTLQAIIQTNFKLFSHVELEVLTVRFAGQRPFNLKYCRDYLGLHLGFTNLFSAKTNQEVIIPLIKEAATTDIIALFHFFKPCLRPKGKGFVLEHLIGTGGINECDQAVVLELFNEMPDNMFIEKFNQYLDNGGNNWQIYNQFLDKFTDDLAPYATRLLNKLTILEGGNINHFNQNAVWGLFNAVQGGGFLENFERYLDRGGNDWRIYNKFLDECKGELSPDVSRLFLKMLSLSPYVSRLFLKLLSLGEDKLLAKFIDAGIDLTQTLEDLKAGKLKLPMPEATDPAKRELASAHLKSLSSMLEINYRLSTKDIILLMQLTTGRQIIDFCLMPGNEASRVEILKAYKDILVPLSPKEILTFVQDKRAVELFREQIIEIGLKSLFEALGEVANPLDITFNLIDKNLAITKQDLEVLRRYPWSQQCAESFIEDLDNPDRKMNIYLHKKPDPSGERVLVFEAVRANQQQSIRNAEQSIPQGNGIFNEGKLGNIIKCANLADLSINSFSRVIKFKEEPNLVDGGGLAVNLLLLFREVRPNHAIARFAGNTKTKLAAATIKTVVDFYNHGPITGTIGLLSNFGQLVKFGIYKTPEQVVKLVTVSTSLAKSVVELKTIIYPSEQCEILLFIAPKFDPGVLTAVMDNTEALKARGYDVFVFNEPISLGILPTAEKYRQAAEKFKAKSIPTGKNKLVDHLIKTFETTFELMMRPTFFDGFAAYNIGLPENVVGDENAYMATNAKDLCANGYTKQIFLSYNMQLQPIQDALRKENFKTTAFTVWETESICDTPIKNSYLEEDMVKTIEYDMSTYKCPIRNASLGFSPSGQVDLMEVATLLNLGEVVILDSYQHPQLNGTKAISSAILNRIDQNKKSRKPRLYFEMTPNELQEAAMRGNEELQYSLGSQFVDHDKFNLAAQWYRRAAEGGFLNAKASLAKLLSEEPEFSTDPNDGFKEARRWAEEAVKEGSIDGLWIMGRVLEYNEGDLLGAEDSYRKAVERGHVEAKNSLVEIRKKIEGDVQVQHNMAIKLIGEKKEEGKLWLRKAANLGFALSQVLLASLLMQEDANDIGKKWVDRAAKRTEAKEWAEKAAKQGHMPGQEILGLILREDYRVKEMKDGNDLKESARWFKKALDQGSTKAEASLKESTNAMIKVALSLSRAGKADEAKVWFKEATSYGPIQIEGMTGALENGCKPIGAEELYNKPVEQGLGQQIINFVLAPDTDGKQAMCTGTQSESSALGQCSLGSNDEESY